MGFIFGYAKWRLRACASVREPSKLRPVDGILHQSSTVLRRLKWTPKTGPLDRGVFVNALPHFNRGYGNDTRPNGPSSPRIRHAGAECAFAFAVGRHTGGILK